jgi:dTDP-4-amino-4,6-dideoxygalactose transaminase
MKTSNPREIINSLNLADIKAIIPTEDWEILGPSSLFPNGLKLSRETVSIPLYPSLTNSEIDSILSVLVKK